ncbi:mannose-1-phosphate guanylyltransferase/mannose-6-phosphate isomerase [Stutzerimonas kunmingensis]|uniref:mannose-1-phosphate guanylyltransferase/mannose-6-phosphate isomerase n=1 Tax=Stutzerimonas kunmingensis TaxID=1211807 RepID=UPI0028A5EC32|nr:mannose-1-phosphate guanylyltransferase/mannose-6-phosphate isomerase [Stutzerimonas kunmingensis]
MFTPVILAGGNGSRLWPLSRRSLPKQFLALDGQGQGSMFQRTLQRLDGLAHAAPLVVSNEQHRFVVAEQLRLANRVPARIILEPLARNTAPAIALAALAATRQGSDPVLLVLAADHFIPDQQAFRTAIAAAQVHADQGQLVTFGIKPTHAETGFGYIQCGQMLGENGHQIVAFKEKPSSEHAEEYLVSGAYLWNSGMFMFRASRYLEELQRLRPDILEACRVAFTHAADDRDFLHVSAEQFARCDDESIDYAVMEQTDDGVVVPLDAGWNDLGSWSAIWDVAPRDAEGNSHQGDVMSVDSRNNLVHAHHRLVTTVGVDDLVVVETKDAVLVSRRDSCQQVKQIVQRLQAEQREEFVSHPLVSRPWGHYDTVDKGDRYQVKRITVLPGECLSLQLHYHRAEHWIVVSGTAKVVCGDKEMVLSENQSTYIPLGVKHSLSNPGKVPLELIEVQSGAYLGEDDIVRFEDRYGRVPS